MFRLLATLVLLVTQTAVGPALEPFRLDDPQVKAYHHIHFNSGLEADSCSSAAIGPHALLTATHCELGTDEVEVDGTVYEIAEKLRDKQDHTILILPSANFKAVLPVSQRDFVTGERVRGWGWPGDFPNVVYKEGYFLGPEKFRGLAGGIFAYPVYGGDSGGALIDESGAVITVVSLGDDAAHMLGFTLAFTTDQLAQASRW